MTQSSVLVLGIYFLGGLESLDFFFFSVENQIVTNLVAFFAVIWLLDIAVDFRVGSPTFGEYVSVELSSTNKKQLFVPKGFLHGFSVLSDDAVVNIKVDNYFASGESIGVRYDDADLNIDWKLDTKEIILGEGDKGLGEFSKTLSPFA